MPPTPTRTEPAQHVLVPDDEQAEKIVHALQRGFDALEALSVQLHELLSAFEEGGMGPELTISLVDIGRLHALLEAVADQREQTALMVGTLRRQLERLNVARIDIDLT